MIDPKWLGNQSRPEYTEAIQYYQEKKEEFENQYQILAKEEGDNGIQQFIEYVQNNLGSKSWEYSADFVKKLEKALCKALQDKDLSELKDFQDKNQKSYGELSNTAKKDLEKLQEKYFDSKIIQKKLQNSLKEIQKGLGRNKASTDQIMSWAKSYCRQYLFNIGKDQKLRPRVDILAGYYQEVLLHKGAVQLISKLQESAGKATHYGAKNTPIDEIIRLEAFDSLNGKETISEPIEIGGQSKLYKVPWALKNPTKGREFYSITSNSQLANLYRAQTSFIKKLRLLEGQYREIFYDNIFFVTNNVFTWTYEYIRQFRDSQYLLTIPKENSDMVYWEKIENTKNS